MNQNSMNLMLLVVFVGVFYFMMIRPQNKKNKAMKEMLAALVPGDEIITIGGIKGTVVQVKDELVVLDIGYGRNTHVKVEFLKSAISSVITKSAKAAKVEEAAEEKAAKTPNKDKKITPKKLTAKKAEATEEAAPAEKEAE